MTGNGDARCFCGSGATHDSCCAPIIKGERAATTAEQLMRSRYSAFCLLDADYLLHSWAPEAKPARLRLDRERRWVGLEIVATSGGGMLDAEGTVEFVARFEDGAQAGAVHEHSRFRRLEGRWAYVDGELGS